MSVKIDISEMIALRDRIQKLLDVDLDAYCSTVTKHVAGELMKIAIQRTPRKTSNLVNAWTTTDIQKVGDTYHIEVINPVEYAEYVEFGHVQQSGRYVKAIGKRLKKGWVEGKFMLTIAERDLQRNLDEIIRQKLEALLMEVINGGK